MMAGLRAPARHCAVVGTMSSMVTPRMGCWPREGVGEDWLASTASRWQMRAPRSWPPRMVGRWGPKIWVRAEIRVLPMERLSLCGCGVEMP